MILIRILCTLLTAMPERQMRAGLDEAELRNRLARGGLRPTPQRLRVLTALAAEPHDVTAQELWRRLRDDGERVALATVYRTVGALAEAGVVDSLSHHRGEACFRLCGDAHHHHLVCTECHRVVELEGCGLEEWLDGLAASAGFRATGHRVEVVGVCGACTR
jgi:Fur family ferric uptake transcriptional regulator